MRYHKKYQARTWRISEAERIAVDPDQISTWVNRLSSIVDGIRRAFVFNMDETNTFHIRCIYCGGWISDESVCNRSPLYG
jgi:hypothetical protein